MELFRQILEDKLQTDKEMEICQSWMKMILTVSRSQIEQLTELEQLISTEAIQEYKDQHH